MSNVYNVSVSGLKAAQLNLMVTSHNITNATTAGYHRQQALQQANTPQSTGAGFIGKGVDVNNIVRSYNQFIDAQVQQAQSLSGYYSTFATEVSQLDNLVTDAGTSLSGPLQDFFTSLQALSANPESVSARQSSLSSANALASRFQLLDTRFQEISSGVNSQIQNAVTEINSYARQIAELNGKIAQAQSGASFIRPNDLYDQRDQLIVELNKWIKAVPVDDGNGSVNVFIGNGQSLVSGRVASQLTAKASAADAQQLDIFYDQPAGQPDILISPKMLAGGALGGLIQFRDQILTTTRNSLGRIALSLADTMNTQHRMGIDLEGQPGRDLFSLAGPRVVSNALNSGTAALGAAITSTNALTTSDYRIVFDGTQYEVTRLSDNTRTTWASLPQTLDGIAFSLSSGAPAAGDSFLIQPTRMASGTMGVNIASPNELALAAPILASRSNNNMGSGLITRGSVTSGLPLNANLTQTVTITFNANNTFNVSGTGTGNPTNVPYTPGAAISYNGWTVAISGVPRAGDTFTVAANSNAVSDNRNLQRLIDLQVSNVMNNGTANFQTSYGQLVSQVGNSAREMQVNDKAQDTIVEQAVAAQQSFSGVNLDEEAANLLRYQQAYQAAAKIMQTAERMFATLLDLGA